MTLTEFINARLGEDEATAKDAGAGTWRTYGPGWREGRIEDDQYEPVVYDEGSPTLEQARHIALHDPARVLRQVTAMRAILALHAPSYPTTYPEPSGQPHCGVCHAGGWDWEPEEWPCPTVRSLVAIYGDHPDYRQEWKP